ncbi:hypothetical protein ECG_00028 [Echinococcus granulosus]|uniref:Expressed protein n=1 Tax=Echinococcus granulosus TaxID=6210 RepID=A0A068WWA7_ECHGR|nr:hypothetical protein ECG_00028 [Echinococcus granulosus]CDS22758.1 expressed protein [Echinococcus granulosus]
MVNFGEPGRVFAFVRRNFLSVSVPTTLAYLIYFDYSKTQQEKLLGMAIPIWFRIKGKEIVSAAVFGSTAAYLLFKCLYNSKTFGLDTYKGRSALYSGRKVPPGVDPWRY